MSLQGPSGDTSSLGSRGETTPGVSMIINNVGWPLVMAAGRAGGDSKHFFPMSWHIVHVKRLLLAGDRVILVNSTKTISPEQWVQVGAAVARMW